MFTEYLHRQLRIKTSYLTIIINVPTKNAFLLVLKIGIYLAPRMITDIYIFSFPIYRYLTNEKRRDNLNQVKGSDSNLSKKLCTILWVRFIVNLVAM